MQYYSTNHQSPKIGFKEAMIRSEAPDGGLYMPERLPVLPKAVINNMPWMSLGEIAFVINNTLFGNDLNSITLKHIGDEVTRYPLPLYEIEPGIYVMEMFHGPTKTVKDFGAQTLSNIIKALKDTRFGQFNVMVATTGNSGNAIARGFERIPGANVFILYPKDTSRLHFDHLNDIESNIHAVQVNGTIDDCRTMIAKAFEDADLNDTMFLTSANSLNIGSLLPSVIPYFNVFAQLKYKKEDPGDIYISMPCGNCGNLVAAYIAKQMGLPVTRLVASCNSNAGIHHFLRGGIVSKGRSHHTLAYGMDTVDTPNFARLKEISHGDMDRLRSDIVSEVCSDSDIADAINDVYARTGYLLDPHSAVAYIGLKRQLPKGASGILIATSHPSKSADVLTKINKGGLKLPFKQLSKSYCIRPEAVMPPTYGALKKYLKYYDEETQAQRFA